MSDYRKSINNKSSLTAVGMLENPVHDLPVQPSITVSDQTSFSKGEDITDSIVNIYRPKKVIVRRYQLTKKYGNNS